MVSLVEAALGFSQGTIYYFTTLKDAANILETGKLFTSTGRIVGDDDSENGRLAPRHVSFTTNPDFSDGYPWNSGYNQLKKSSPKKYLIALVRFSINVEKLKDLVKQVQGEPKALPFSFNHPDSNKKPEWEERLWLSLSKISDFPTCVESICINDEYDSETDYLNQLATNVFDEAKELGIPIFYRDFRGRESELKTPEYLFGRFGKGSNWRSGKQVGKEDPFGGKYEAFVRLLAICCLRKFGLQRQGILNYLSRFSQVLGDREHYKLILDVEQQVENYLKDPKSIKLGQEPNWVLTKEFEGDKNLQQILIQSVERACKQANVQRVTQLVTVRKHQVEANDLQESNMEKFDFKEYLSEGWLFQEAEKDMQ